MRNLEKAQEEIDKSTDIKKNVQKTLKLQDTVILWIVISFDVIMTLIGTGLKDIGGSLDGSIAVYWVFLVIYLVAGIPIIVVFIYIDSCEGKSVLLGLVRRFLSYLAGGLFLAGDNVELLWGNKIDRVVFSSGTNGEEFRSYLNATALLSSLLAQFLPIVVSTSNFYSSNSSNSDDKQKCKLCVACISTKPCNCKGYKDKDNIFWWKVIQGLFSYIAFSVIIRQFYNATLNELTRNGATTTTEIVCPAGPMIYAFVLFGILSVIWFIALFILIIGNKRLNGRKEDYDPKEKAKNKHRLFKCFGIILYCIAFPFLPVFLFTNNNWPWICVIADQKGYFIGRFVMQFVSLLFLGIPALMACIKSAATLQSA